MTVPIDDRGLLLGDGLFETLAVRDGQVLHMAAHLDRMAAGCLALGLPPLERAQAAAVIGQAASGLPAPRLAVRLTLTAGSGGRGLDRSATPQVRMFATAAISTAPTTSARLATVGIRRNEGSPASRLKTLAYLDNVLARKAARDLGGDEALMLNNRGEVACGAAANIFWVADGRLFTPALDCGVLAGVTRERVLKAAERMGMAVAEVRAPRADLDRAEGIFLTNSLIGVRAVDHWDGRAIATPDLIGRLAEEII